MKVLWYTQLPPRTGIETLLMVGSQTEAAESLGRICVGVGGTTRLWMRFRDQNVLTAFGKEPLSRNTDKWRKNKLDNQFHFDKCVLVSVCCRNAA